MSTEADPVEIFIEETYRADTFEAATQGALDAVMGTIDLLEEQGYSIWRTTPVVVSRTKFTRVPDGTLQGLVNPREPMWYVTASENLWAVAP